MKKSAPDMYANTDQVIKQRFAERVHDRSLRRELKRLNKESPSLKLFQLRDEAVAWMKDSQAETSELQSLRELTMLNQQHIQVLTQTMQEQVERSQKTADIVQQNLTYKSRDFSNFRSRSRGRRRGAGR